MTARGTRKTSTPHQALGMTARTLSTCAVADHLAVRVPHHQPVAMTDVASFVASVSH